MSSRSRSELDSLIPPEIRDDPFSQAIRQIARDEPLGHILEIGSSSGEGSTLCFVEAIRENRSRPTLHCMEVSRTRFEALATRYLDDPLVRLYNLSSVRPEAFATEQSVRDFFAAHGGYPVEETLRWRRQDLDYVRHAGVPQDGIEEVRRQSEIDRFDLVLIDGSEFTASAELDLVYGASYILLDDINSFKNFANFAKLSADSEYVLLHHRPDIRNGFAIFRRRDVAVRSYATVAPAVERIPGFLLPGQEQYLFDKARSLAEDALILEIGSYKGRSTAALGFACAGTGRRIICIDTWNGNDTDFADRDFHETWIQNLRRCGLLDVVTGVRGESREILPRWGQVAAGKPVDFAFIDGSHQHADVLRDFELTWPITRDGGWIALHDVHYTWPGPLRVWHDIAGRSLINHEYASTLACGQKTRDRSLVLPAPVRLTRERTPLPVHFFTIVLNGRPFIEHHLEQFRKLPFDWHWHIVEGAARLERDTAWSVAAGGRVPEAFHRDGRSIDGTSEYLDRIQAELPDRVTVYRKPPGELWAGKVEMVNQPLNSIAEDCLLFEIDADELWTARQLGAARELFLKNPSKTAAMYWCWFFVGPDRVISTRNCYGNNPRIEWLRTWRYRPGMRWASHEPPILVEPLPDGRWRNVAEVDPILHAQTEAAGLVFQHHAYATEDQARFKETYYGYAGAVEKWRALQALEELPARLGDFFPWVRDQTQVDWARHYVAEKLIDPGELPAVHGQLPVAGLEESAAGNRQLAIRNPSELRTQDSGRGSGLSPSQSAISPRVLVDGVFFQYFQTGIARVWKSLLEEWVQMGWADHVLAVDRGGTMPKIPRIRYVSAPRHNYADLAADRAMLGRLCARHGIDVFMSTYYTRAQAGGPGEAEGTGQAEIPHIVLVHDMIPELFEWDLRHPMWREKHEAIASAAALACVSDSTARDLRRFFPDVAKERILVTPLAAARAFHPRPPEQVDGLRRAIGMKRPYFLIVGARGGYKNTVLTFGALAGLEDPGRFELLCAGHVSLEEEYRQLVPNLRVHCFHLTDEELAAAYSGAVALLHPSTYEGFGLPVLEAMACGCPVITTKNGALAEVAGDAAIFVSGKDLAQMARAIEEVQRLEARDRLIRDGLEQAKRFSWRQTAAMIRMEIEEQAAARRR